MFAPSQAENTDPNETRLVSYSDVSLGIRRDDPLFLQVRLERVF